MTALLVLYHNMISVITCFVYMILDFPEIFFLNVQVYSWAFKI